jgi:sec-independent protein translocase protein TatA
LGKRTDKPDTQRRLGRITGDPTSRRGRTGFAGERNRSERIMVGLDNPLHIAILLVVLLVIFGAKRLPEMGRSLGSGLRNFKESVTGADHQAPTQLDARDE